jgi:hypothetical protein
MFVSYRLLVDLDWGDQWRKVSAARYRQEVARISTSDFTFGLRLIAASCGRLNFRGIWTAPDQRLY